MGTPQDLPVATEGGPALVLVAAVIHARVADPEAVDAPRDAVEQGVGEERHVAERRVDDARSHDPPAQPGQGGRLEAGHRPAAQPLVADGGDRHEPQDRRHAGRCRGALQPARDAEEHEAGRDPGQHDRHRPEGRAELHDPVVAVAIGEHAEQGREEKLRREERRGEEAQHDRVDLLTAVLRQVVEVVDEHGAGQARAEAQGERPEDDGPQRTIHPVQGTRPARPWGGGPAWHVQSVRGDASPPRARPTRPRSECRRRGAPPSRNHGRPRDPAGRRQRRRRGDRDERGARRRLRRGLRDRRRRLLAHLGRGLRLPGRAQRLRAGSGLGGRRGAAGPRPRDAPVPRTAHDHGPGRGPLLGRRPRPLRPAPLGRPPGPGDRARRRWLPGRRALRALGRGLGGGLRPRAGRRRRAAGPRPTVRSGVPGGRASASDSRPSPRRWSSWRRPAPTTSTRGCSRAARRRASRRPAAGSRRRTWPRTPRPGRRRSPSRTAGRRPPRTRRTARASSPSRSSTSWRRSSRPRDPPSSRARAARPPAPTCAGPTSGSRQRSGPSRIATPTCPIPRSSTCRSRGSSTPAYGESLARGIDPARASGAPAVARAPGRRHDLARGRGSARATPSA